MVNRKERPLGLIEKLAEAALALEADGRVARANVRASELFGRPTAELIGRRADQLMPSFPVETHVKPDGRDGRILTLRDISERVEVQTSLRAGSERLALDGPNARVGSWEWNIATGTVRWSAQLYRIYGYEPGALAPTYAHYLSLVHPDERESVEARHRKVLADHEPFSHIKRMTRADGAEILVRTDGEIIVDEQLAEAALELEADGRVSLANVAASELFGLSRADLVGVSAKDLLAERLRRDPASGRAFELDRGAPAVHDDGALAATRADGNEFPVEVRVTPDGDGRIVTLRDISERLEAQLSLRKGPARLTQDAADARVGSWEWDIPANTVRWSDQLYRIYGLEPGSVEPTYERFLAHVHPEDREAVNGRNQKAFADHQPFKDVKRVVRADGREIQMRTQGEVITDGAGSPLRMIGVCEDVTDYERTHALLAGLS